MVHSIRNRLIHLHFTNQVSRRLLRTILYKDPSLSSIYSMTPSDWHQLFHLPVQKAALLYQSLHSSSVLQHINKNMKQYAVITIVDEVYPPVLKTIKDAPIVLYALGDVHLLKQIPALSVIGTRTPSNVAWDKISHIVKPIIQENWVIVSGMAKGIDSYAHRLALTHQGKTIAVMGSGFEYIYPQENKKLFETIAYHGLILSEYPPYMPPKPYQFPERNRIISGLSFGTLVIEASLRSGTLITVEQALDQGREVYAVPGSPLSKQTEGCHKIIQEGAKLAHNARDILEDWQQSGHNWEQVCRS